MPTYQEPIVWCDYFDRAQALTTTPGFNGWTVKDTSSSGTPTYLIESGLGMVLTLVNTSEAEIVTMFHNNVLQFDIDELQSVEFGVRVNGIDAVTTLVIGMASAQDDVADNVANHAWFRMEGSASTSNLLVETDDGTTDDDDNATGTTLASTIKKLRIDFTNGKSDIRFYVNETPVSGTFSMAAATGSLQPFVQLQKASGTGVPDVEIHWVKIIYSKVFD